MIEHVVGGMVIGAGLVVFVGALVLLRGRDE